MLFALFFGAGNLIFPALLGQMAGDQLWPAIGGFLITGVGLPFLGILAMGFSGSRNLQELASRVHPVYAILFTSLLYLTIGPFFAAPRTGAVAFEIGIAPFVEEGNLKIALLIFTFLFFGITLWLSLNPAKMVDRVGKLLSPAIIVLLLILLVTVLLKPLGVIQPPSDAFIEGAFFKGFTEGYNTMDALASLVFGIIVIHVIRSMGVVSRKGIMVATAKTGSIAILFLALIYIGIAYLGATSVEKFGLFDNGGLVLSSASSYYFGSVGALLLSVVIILACLTTAIGLITACGEYFHTLLPKISYQQFVILFTVFCFVIANFGLSNIITYSIPVLMFLYPLAVALMLLTFLSPVFLHARFVYVSAIFITFFISIVDGLKTLFVSLEKPNPEWLSSIIQFYDQTLPFYADGLGWFIPVVIVLVITTILARLLKPTTPTEQRR